MSVYDAGVGVPLPWAQNPAPHTCVLVWLHVAPVCNPLCLCVRSVPGTMVGVVVGQDLNPGDGFTFSLLDAFPASPFVVTGSGSVVVAGSLDFEATAEYRLTVVVNETGTGSSCGGLSSSAVVTVSVVDVAEAPVVTAAPLVVSVGEGDVWPCRLQPKTWYGSSGPGNGSSVSDGPCSSTGFGYGYLTAVDPKASNTSLMTVGVEEVLVLMVEREGAPAVSRFPSGATWVSVVRPGGGGPCGGGAACELEVSASSPALDYDTGLRGLVVTLAWESSAGLVTRSVVEVEVRPRNEGTVPVECCAMLGRVSGGGGGAVGVWFHPLCVALSALSEGPQPPLCDLSLAWCIVAGLVW